MGAEAKRILDEALALSEEDRRRIGRALLESVPAEALDEIEAAWVAEAVRRAEELERGDVEALAGVQVLGDLKARFQCAGG